MKLMFKELMLNDIYSIRTLTQVLEVQDLGNWLKLVVMVHRRIKIVNQIFEDANPKVEHGTKNILHLHVATKSHFIEI
ncbi:hypothetical protein ALC56_10007 [Trachymyrmex septentrionalis]|uniref:Uncharacterized protein n=1 Tax=Trachymyrmex septentrionalis TaxID=34720 RepID=A0A151K3U9_9HYME|nr:hypothetical protein ALC56_10007 [Trachymyrmex septentrionalis]